MAHPNRAKMARLLVISLLLLTSGLLAQEHLIRNQDAEILLGRINIQIQLKRQRVLAGQDPGEIRYLTRLLDQLAVIVERDNSHRVDTAGTSVELEAVNDALFREPPILPPENKKDGRWYFEPIRFDVVPRSLFIFGLRFRGLYTIRIRQVTLKFRDGGPDVVENLWNQMEDGNGREFDRHTLTPLIKVWEEGSSRRARPLAAVEILGSTQDGGWSAPLEFLVEVPTPENTPHQDLPALLSRFGRKWSDLTDLDLETLDRLQADLEELAAALGVPLPSE